MKLKFWGVRGSIPTPETYAIGIGGNTSCVSVQVEDYVVIFDAGTGLRNLGKYLEDKERSRWKGSIFLSHYHWDHIQGLPFFDPAYQGGTMKVKEAMNQEVVLIEGDSSIQTATHIMEKSGTDSIPVVFDKHISGMITEHDIDTKIISKGLNPKAARVSDGMTEGLYVCGEDDKIENAAKKMKRCRVRQLAVMNRYRHLVGMVSFEDLAKNIERQH